MMGNSNKLNTIDAILKSTKDSALKSIDERLKHVPRLDELRKDAEALADNADAYTKKGDNVSQVVQYGLDYAISKGLWYFGKNYIWDFGKMYAKELGLFAGAFLAFQAVANPALVVDLANSAYSGLKTTVGNYTSLFNSTEKAVKPKIYVKELVLDEGVKAVSNGTKANASDFKIEAKPEVMPEPIKMVNETHQDNHFDASHPFLVSHNGMQFLLTPYHSGTMSDHM